MGTPRPKYVAVIDFGRGRDRYLAGEPVLPGPALETVLSLPPDVQAKFITRSKSPVDQPAAPAQPEE